MLLGHSSSSKAFQGAKNSTITESSSFTWGQGSSSTEMVKLKQIADKHNLDPHSLRVLLRSTGIRAEGRYEWEDDDPFLTKIEDLIKNRPPAPARSTKTKSSKPKVPRVFPRQEMPAKVPPAAKLIERLDQLAANGKYDDVGLAFAHETVIYSWQINRLRNLEWIMSKGELPIAFIAFKWAGSRLDLTIWHAPWDASEGSLIAAEWVLTSPLAGERTQFEINQLWAGS